MKKLVVFTGAGVSAESGLQTFRDSDGLWEGYRVEDVATPGAWRKDPQMVLRFYNERRKNITQAMPNAAHKMVKELESDFDVQIITQNIDDLHERAGSKNVLHLHGEIFKMRSEKNTSETFPIYDDMQLGDFAPDGSQLRPAIVWFEEAVPMIEPAIELSRQADVFVVIGTSLVVYPAASLLHYIDDEIPLLVLDKKIPSIRRNNIITIEKPASEGASDLKNHLLNLL